MLRELVDLLQSEVDGSAGRWSVGPERIRALRNRHKSPDPDAVDLRREHVDKYFSAQVVE